MENEIKLIELSENSWHYKLMLWFLGDNSPKPSNTFNFCRYFWILMFVCVIMVPIVGPFKLLFKLIYAIGNFVDKYIYQKTLKSLEKWVISLDAYTAYEIYNYGSYGRIPKKFKKVNVSGEKLLTDWAKENLNLDWDNMSDREQILIELKKVRDEREQLRYERQRKAELKEEKRDELIRKINNKLGFLSDAWDSITSSLEKLSSLDFTTMIKVAKKVTGVLITLLFLFVTYFIVNYLTLGLIAGGIFIMSIWKIILQVILAIVIGTVIVFLLYKLFQIIAGHIEDVVAKYKHGGSVWYIQVLYLGIVKPLYYVVYTPLYWLVLIPLNFIFNHFIWRFLCLKVFKSFGLWFWEGMKNFTGIFGDYFSASKKDYCPGITWKK